MTFGAEPAALVAAVRRLLTRQPGVGPLWWLGSKMVAGADPAEAAWDSIAELRSDRTDRELAHGLPDGATVVIAGWPDRAVDGLVRRGDLSVLVVDVGGQGFSVARRLSDAEVEVEVIDAEQAAAAVESADVVILEAAAVGDHVALVELGGLTLAALGRVVGTPVWLTVPVGRRLAEPYVQAITERLVAADRVPWVRTVDVVGLGLIAQCVTPEGVVTVAELGEMTAPFAPELLG